MGPWDSMNMTTSLLVLTDMAGSGVIKQLQGTLGGKLERIKKWLRIDSRRQIIDVMGGGACVFERMRTPLHV